jgi:catechol 2,3-dioxygenase-like lactoylglutathione lyase family enzyme
MMLIGGHIPGNGTARLSLAKDNVGSGILDSALQEGFPMNAIALGFTKLVVGDLDTSERFYRDVFGMKSLHRVVTEEHKYALEEVVMSLSGARDEHALIITRYLRRPCPPSGSAWTGFVVGDIAATLKAVETAGGRIEVGIHENAEHGVLAAIAADPDGHLIEIIQVVRPQ